jgi:hypothetical protein
VLWHAKAPSGKAEEDLRRAKLAVYSDNVNVLQFSKRWGMAAIDDWLRSMFTDLFTWLGAKYGRPVDKPFHWVLLGRDRSQLYVLDRVTTTGIDLVIAKGTAGRGVQQCAIRIGKELERMTCIELTR